MGTFSLQIESLNAQFRIRHPHTERTKASTAPEPRADMSHVEHSLKKQADIITVHRHSMRIAKICLEQTPTTSTHDEVCRTVPII